MHRVKDSWLSAKRELDTLAEAAEAAYEEEYDDGVSNLGWEYLGMNFEITSPMQIS